MAELIGQRIGQYEIKALLGEGGMAGVYRAYQTSMKRDVAIKIIKTGLIDMAEFTKRFEIEAQTVANLSHPHIVKVFDYGQQEDMVYLVMELLSGGSLAKQIEAGQMSFKRISQVLDQVASALDYAHQKGIIHRDLKPENILLDEADNCFLTDFGLAKLMSSPKGLTQTGILVGTPSYMAPEQWQSEPLDARTDVYALGVMLFEMLCGRLPFFADSVLSIMYMHVHEPPPLPQTIRSDLPPEVSEVVMMALEKNPARRFASTGQLARAFKEAVVHHKAPATASADIPAASPAQPAIPSPRITFQDLNAVPKAAPRPGSNPTNAGAGTASTPAPERSAMTLTLALAGIAAIVVLLVGVFVLRGSLFPQPALPTVAQLAGAATETQTSTATPITPTATATSTMTATPTRTASPTATPTRTIAPSWTPLPTQQGRMSIDNPGSFGGGPGGPTPPGRNGGPPPSPPANGGPGNPFPSPVGGGPGGNNPGNTGVSGKFSATLFRSIKAHDVAVRALTLSQDGKQLLTASDDGTAKVYNLEAGALILTLKGHADGVTSALFLPGRGYLTASRDKTIRLWDLKGNETHKYEGHTAAVLSLALAGNSHLFVSGSADKTARMWDLNPGHQIQAQIYQAGATVNAVAFAQDNRFILTGASDGTITQWNPGAGEKIGTFIRHKGAVWSLALTPDGASLVSGAADNAAMLWDVSSHSLRTALVGNLADVTGVALVHDDQWIITISADGKSRVFNGTTGKVEGLLENGTVQLNCVAVSENNQMMAVGTNDGDVHVYRLQ